MKKIWDSYGTMMGCDHGIYIYTHLFYPTLPSTDVYFTLFYQETGFNQLLGYESDW